MPTRPAASSSQPPTPKIIKPVENPNGFHAGDVVIKFIDHVNEHALLLWSSNVESTPTGVTGQDVIGHPEWTRKRKEGEGDYDAFLPHNEMNIVGRVHEDQRDNEFCVVGLASAVRKLKKKTEKKKGDRLRFDFQFNVYRKLPNRGAVTNCTGFVASAFRMQDPHVLLMKEDFGQSKAFICPVKPPTIRTSPTPGHLARVFAEERVNYEPIDAKDAEQWKLAQTTDTELRKALS